ncbi:FAS1 domain-containing protein [Actinidia chinensis var. chinensis]|uniref:FAS1 domain-containing protein n=1 Tax=Actinidia chinensis var. chinensis TaxID=1590841 RepID=A0A2R6RSH5_ACTCC|nr:FAS1 domain-containing protein [Actinidia chinensis var. chinensis]
MATYMALSALLVALIMSSATATPTPSRNQDLLVATEEMQKANHFTFVMLINMAPATLIQGNVTFLMPNDRALAKTLMPENTVIDFLLRHSIPSPLLFDHLVHIPTGSVLPTEKPEFMLKVLNEGRNSFYLNNVKIISPNICTAGSSIRCHGIDGVVQATMVPEHNTTLLPPPTCSNGSSPMPAAAPSAPSWPSPAPPVGGLSLIPSIAQPPTGSHKSDSSPPLPFGGLLLGFVITYLMFLTEF